MLLRYLVALFLCAVAFAQDTANTAAAKQQVLWQKLEASITEVDRHLDGVMGVAIEDLSSGQRFQLHGDAALRRAQ